MDDFSSLDYLDGFQWPVVVAGPNGRPLRGPDHARAFESTLGGWWPLQVFEDATVVQVVKMTT